MLSRFRGGLGRLDRWVERHLDWLAVAVLVAGFVFRWQMATAPYFELDEAYHVRLSVPWFPKLWDTAHEPTHPPLLIFLLHYVWYFGQSELAFRMIPLVAGVALPWFFYKWLELAWSRAAGFVALVMLALAPALTLLSAVVRAYTLGLLLAGMALYFLERAIRERSARWMAAFTLALWLGIEAENTTAFFCVAAGVYFLARIREVWDRRAVVAIWVVSQLGALGLYVHFVFRQVLRLRAAYLPDANNPNSFLGPFFPQDGENRLDFALRAVFGTFELTYDSKVAATVGVVLFAAGIVAVWLAVKRPLPVRVAMCGFLIAPLAVSLAGAFTKTYPLGDSRQSIHMAVFFAVAAGIALAWVFRQRALPVALAVLWAAPFWYGEAELKPHRWKTYRPREDMTALLAYLRENVPPGSRLLVEGFFAIPLEHYLMARHYPPRHHDGEVHIGGYRFYRTTPVEWQSFAEAWRLVAEWREKNEFEVGETIWVIDGGFYCNLGAALDREPELARQAPNARRFGRSILVFEAPAGFDPRAEPPAAEPVGRPVSPDG